MQEAINTWFNQGCDFTTGVALYKQLPVQNSKVLKSLSRGKNSYNKSLLIKELRRAKFVKPPTPKKISQPEKPNQPVTDVEIAVEFQQKKFKEQSANRFLNRITYNNLPPELRIMYRKVKDIFYDMCDLKFILNDIPAKDEKKALAIQLQIEENDAKRKVIWETLEHWEKHKTLLPTQADEFKELSPKELWSKFHNLKSNITKLKQRIDVNYDRLDMEKDKHQIRLIENKINKQEKLLHQHKLNKQRIKELL